MDELGDRLRTAAGAREDEWHGAQPPQAVRRSIMRARTLRLGGIGVVAAAVLVGVGAAGIGLSSGDPVAEPSPITSADLSLDATVAYATVPFPEEQLEEGMHNDHQWCGSAPPVSEAAGQDFSAEFEVPTTFEFDPMIRTSDNTPGTATLTYHGDQELPVFLERPRALFVDDGVVVGWVPWHSPARPVQLMPGQSTETQWERPPMVVGCEGDEYYDDLQAGEYDVVLVWEVRNNPSMAAVEALRRAGYALPPKSEVAAFREGGFECSTPGMYFMNTPITCEPRALPGVEIDYEAGTATLPYDPAAYVRDVDLTFVSEPFRAAVAQRDNEYIAADWDMGPTYDPDVVPACGDVYSDSSNPDLVGVWRSTDFDARHIAAGDILEPELWRRALGWSEAEVTLPSSPRLWLMTGEEIIVEEGEATLRFTGLKVVGWIDAHATQVGSLHIDRYAGPKPWPLEVTEVGWCEGAGDPGPFSATLLGTSVIVAVEGQPDIPIEPLIFTR